MYGFFSKFCGLYCCCSKYVFSSNFDFKTTCFFEEFFNNYKHSNELIYDIWIKFYQNKINLCIITNNYSESFSDGRNVEEDKFLYSKNYITNTGDVENTIKQLLLFIYNLKYDYMYSKITDNIESKETIKSREQIKLSKMLLTHDILENCCVCIEPNIVLTSCNHNLCRECYKHITKNKKHPACPICRMCLFCEEYEDY